MKNVNVRNSASCKTSSPANSRLGSPPKWSLPDADLLDHRWPEWRGQNQHEDFAFETTLAGRGYLKLVRQLRSQGWRVGLIYLALPSLEMSKMRVAERVAHGGHNIPIADIERRFARSLANLLQAFGPAVDFCRCVMNDGDVPILVFEQTAGRREVIDDRLYQLLVEESRT